MLTCSRIDRFAAAHRYGALIHEVLANGRPLPGPARRRIAGHELQSIVGNALALIRRIELSGEASSPAVAALAGRLVNAVSKPGFGPLAGAAGLAALGRARAAGLPACVGLEAAVDHAAHAVTAAIQANREAGGPGLIGRGEHRALDTALALWFLADASDVSGHGLAVELARALEAAGPLDPATRSVRATALAGASTRTAA
ncbi:MAG: hypothetical protein D6693_05590 [Planctomycetota bacterium]|nr:MAG: hypothetical protein D6693_05590 [Planctomycetota bacterium]